MEAVLEKKDKIKTAAEYQRQRAEKMKQRNAAAVGDVGGALAALAGIMKRKQIAPGTGKRREAVLAGGVVPVVPIMRLNEAKKTVLVLAKQGSTKAGRRWF